MPNRMEPPSETGILADLVRQSRRHTTVTATSTIENVNTVTASGAAQTLPDVDTATMHAITLTANCTFTFPDAAAGKSFSVRLKQDGTGSRTATWPGTVKWDSATAPTLSTAANSVDAFAFACFDGTNWLGFFAGKGMG